MIPALVTGLAACFACICFSVAPMKRAEGEWYAYVFGSVFVGLAVFFGIMAVTS